MEPRRLPITRALGITEHPLRRILLEEVHARPFETLRAPLLLSHLALFSGAEGQTADHEHMAALCRRLNVAPPEPGSTHYVVEAGDYRVRWERHTEFSTYTFFCEGHCEPFSETAVEAPPRDWMANLPGQLVAACHIQLLDDRRIVATPESIGRFFDSETLVGSRCAGDAATVWTDFQPDESGFTHFLVLGTNLVPAQAGRLVRRLLELETYRLMALLALPLARGLGPEINAMERELGDLTDRTAVVSSMHDDRALLESLSVLSARVERLMARSGFRFSAGQAYGTLVRRRIAALREQRIEGVSTIDEFMERRFGPALDTCAQMRDRLERMSKRVSRAANLLRTRVDVALEAQNRDLLRSMNRRARLQLRLQETVEGLSVVILSYYTVSLIGYALKALEAGGIALRSDLIIGLSIPVVVLVVALGIRAIRRRVARADRAGEEQR